MSGEETKGEAGETEVALTEEKCLYDDALRRYKEAGVDVDEARKDLDKARKRLQDWENEHPNENVLHPEYCELDARVERCNQRLNDANQILEKAYERVKDARAAAGKLTQPVLHFKQPRYSWKRMNLPSPLFKMDPESKTFKFGANFLSDFELVSNAERLILYCRSMFNDQIDFLTQTVIEKGRVGYVFGPPGTGKSSTALAFASMLNREEWTVTWIRLSRISLPVCVRIEEDSKSVRSLRCADYYSELDEILNEEVEEQTKHIVFLDGMTTKHLKAEQMCISWRKQNKTNRRLVIVSSMSSRWKAKAHEDDVNDIDKFIAYSWTQREYLDAIQNDALFQSIRGNLDSSGAPGVASAKDDSRVELVQSKFYFAGGSARFMFEYSTGRVIDELDDSIAATSNALTYSSGEVGARSNGVINRLFGSYKSIVDGREKIVIVSQQAASALAIAGGPVLIKNLVSSLHQDWNPAVDGWVLEMLFFARLKHGGVDLLDSDKNPIDKWCEANIRRFDPCNIATLCFPQTDIGVWLKPVRWNQGGYDGVFLDQKKKTVRFIQVTRSETHSLKLEYFYSFLSMLMESEASFEIESLEIVFLVDVKKLSKFRILDSGVTGQGLLAAFRGWEKGDEWKTVKAVGIDSTTYFFDF